VRGLFVPLITPFDVDDRVDLDALDRLARRVLSEGATGLVALGTTGEPAVLDPGERRAVVDACAAVCREAGRPLIVGAGGNCTRTSIEDVQTLAGVPALAGTLVVTPYYTLPSANGIVEHYAAVAAASPVPVIAYNVPYRSGRGLAAADLLRLAERTNVVAVKQAVGSLDTDTLELLSRAPGSFHVLSGDDAVIAPMMLMGATGAIAASAHVCTPRFAAMVEAAGRGDGEGARRRAAALLPVVRAGFAEPSPAVWKAALHASGEIASPMVRAPLTVASPAATATLVRAVAAAG
jgi:4-hydroxy-tetrahydrodipicolinate synthase